MERQRLGEPPDHADLLLRGGSNMAATIYEPLSTAHLKSCTVDFDSRPDKKAVNLVQYDQTIPVLCVSLKKSGTEYKVPSDADVNIRMDKRDGYHVYNPALGVNAERTIAYFAVTPQMSTGWGDYYPIVEITVGGGIAGSAPIWLHFDRNPLPENAIISSDEYKTIQQLLEDVTAVKAATEQIKAQTEAVRDQAKGFADNAKNSADKAQTLVDGMPSDYSQAMKDIGTLKNQMQRAYPDDSTIGENTWSSKNIVDMLCPPLEESGNPVVCYPVAGYPLGVKAKWEPMQEGSGDPSPENIRPIKGRDSVKVERCGENLSTTAGLDGVGWATTYEDLLNVLNKLPAGTYVLDFTFTLEEFFDRYTSDTAESNAFRINSRFDDGTPCIVTDGEMITKAEKLPSVRKITKTFVITPQNKGRVATAYLYACGRDEAIDGAPNGSLGEGKISNVTITLGNTAPTTYTPYNGSTNTLTLPETVYGGEVDAVSGEGIKNWERVTFDGTEKWKYDTRGFFIYILPQKAKDDLVSLCDRYTGKYTTTAEALRTEGKLLVVGTSVCGYTAVSEWIAYLAAQYAAGTPVQICYELAEPVLFTATGAQPLPALKGTNTVLTDADSATVTGRADPIKRITDLEDAVASQT
jgi:hypothetical protein